MQIKSGCAATKRARPYMFMGHTFSAQIQEIKLKHWRASPGGFADSTANGDTRLALECYLIWGPVAEYLSRCVVVRVFYILEFDGSDVVHADALWQLDA